MKKYNEVVNEMKKHRSVKRFNKKDVQMIMQAKTTGDWSKVYNTKLYIVNGGDFCSLLEVLNGVQEVV
jgi:hypothetical protein